MTVDSTLWSYIINAGFVVKCVILILFVASIASWTMIIERMRFYKKQWKEAKAFEKEFWSGASLANLLQNTEEADSQNGLIKIFKSGFNAFSQFQSSGKHSRDEILSSSERAMQIAESKIIDELEKPLSLLATIGSVSPYVGLFGTVWGIMTAFQALGHVQQASIGMVAPGISEALIATAIGLFAAIPAVIAYNRFNQQVARLQNYYETFSAELSTIFHKQV
ncbi:MAG: protein TolQ [Gammaproteobacteria bacterium RIFCSPLOWO2_02_FULL_42_14]|nr:MAG: protein TolQ [Gammaproteobacteria bacterium RIFCSPHIGHO2_02_FULL_42_43]OGT29145.1 MAG: protein TolQ [Gammaproteobacteria bacterium RIFCSPHIGHO2_01_FULL_42_8]OGT52949.1 MAG: protein TolQ [Gammaproteobacteria bacterium RIFCSPHIGHO2_12_FULL_41_25]OGT61277.1 MAG: protein TolQ [Gammaproteobacteria bacterium RIFCSPLOWO2_02_FULL_42_14]OGT87206.1 MAG: protein TolQ [Gammaproteobacteria bacterium RIFCSPLOWO2_12_FULL_42_18]